MLQQFQRWIFRVEASYWRNKGVPPPMALADSVSYRRPRVIISSRPLVNIWR